MSINIIFEKVNRAHWLSTIIKAKDSISHRAEDNIVEIYINSKVTCNNIESWHIVSLACLLDYAVSQLDNVRINITASDKLVEFLAADLHLSQYFAGKSHVESDSREILNLWKVKPTEALLYSDRLSTYLRQTYFKDKDVSLLQTMLDELYANISDHSRSNGVAYSFIKYIPEREMISVAFCDFGIGIPGSLKLYGKKSEEQQGYIKYATTRGVSVKSNIHNAGYGLATVLECMEGSEHFLRIVSNDEAYYHYNARGILIEKTFKLNFHFPGTLVYYNLDISQFQSEEVVGYINFVNEMELPYE